MNIKIRYISLLLPVIGLISSCCGKHTEIEYKYDNVYVKRIDECGKSMFYYNKIGEVRQTGFILAKYSGINDGFSGYLVFQENGKVLLLSGDGYFQSKNIDTTLFDYRRITAVDRPNLTENVYMIMLSTRYEQELNDTTKTKVTASYKIDKNEWW